MGTNLKQSTSPSYPSSPQNHLRTNYSRQRSIAINPRFKSSVKFKKINCCFSDKKQLVDFAVVKELDEETNLYYYGARYLDPRTSRWLTGDPAIYQGDYIPVAPINDEARKHNQNLPGMGGIFNTVNMHAYHYAGNNPVKYVDPTGRNGDEPDYNSGAVFSSIDLVIRDAQRYVRENYQEGLGQEFGGFIYIVGEGSNIRFGVSLVKGDREGMVYADPNILRNGEVPIAHIHSHSGGDRTIQYLRGNRVPQNAIASATYIGIRWSQHTRTNGFTYSISFIISGARVTLPDIWGNFVSPDIGNTGDMAVRRYYLNDNPYFRLHLFIVISPDTRNFIFY